MAKNTSLGIYHKSGELQKDVYVQAVRTTVCLKVSPPPVVVSCCGASRCTQVLDAWTELYMDMAEECINRSEELYTEVESKPGGWRGTREFVLQAKEVKSASVTQFTFVPKVSPSHCAVPTPCFLCASPSDLRPLEGAQYYSGGGMRAACSRTTGSILRGCTMLSLSRTVGRVNPGLGRREVTSIPFQSGTCMCTPPHPRLRMHCKE